MNTVCKATPNIKIACFSTPRSLLLKAITAMKHTQEALNQVLHLLFKLCKFTLYC